MKKLYKVSIKPHRLLLVLALVFSTHLCWSQDMNVSGTVTSGDDGMGIPGALVAVKGTTNSVATDIDGNYTISAPLNAVLQFSFIGYQSQEVTVTGNTVNVVLQEEAQELNEVVIVGYGAQRKEAVTGSVVSIKGDAIREVPAPNITQALQGRLAGVEINQTSSQPGASMQIRIRGARSLTASNNPLIVLDGIPFPGSLTDISTDDIKSIDVLKDASATAIYGSRGANGVILITTNRGTLGQKAKFTYSSYYGVRNVFSDYPMMGAAKYAKLRADAGMFSNGIDESDDINTDWQDLFYRTGTVENHHFNVSGGSATGSYSFSTTYYKDEGVIPLQDYERFSLVSSLDQQIGNYVRVGFNTNNNYSITNGSTLGTYGVLSMSPLANPYNEDGSWKRTVSMPLDEQWVYSRDIMNNLGDSFLDQNKAFASYNTVYGEVKIPGVEGLKYRLNLGGNIRMSTGGTYTGEGVFSTNPDTPSTATINNSFNSNWAVENILSYDRTFGGKHTINAIALYSAQENFFNSSSISAREIPSDAFQFFNLGQAQGEITINPANQSYQKSGLVSYMGRLMYSYDDRYMVSATFRSDASSRLAPGHQWHSYPAVSAGWNIANESFMNGLDEISLLKLRVGYGETSNQAVDPYKTLGLLSTRPYNFGGDFVTGYYVSELPNPNLGWEFSKTWNYGLDFGLFNNRLSGTLEYYVQNTNNVLLGVNLPPTAGVGSYTANIGETQNKGFELSLKGLILDNPNGVTWSAGFNLYSNKNKLTALASGQQEDEANWWFVGKPINVIYDYNRLGLWQEGDPYLDILEPGGNVGMIKVEYTGDYNEDGTPTRAIGPDDRQVLDVNPDFQGGFNTNVNYKNFDLGIVGGFQSGGILISTLYGSTGYLNMLNGRRGNVDVDYWTPENTDVRYPKPGGITSGDNPKYGSTLSYFDASYVKIRTITLGYTFNQDFIKKVGIDKLRLYTTVQNAFVLYSPYHKETGLDPEPNSYGNQNAAVTDAYQSRLLTVGTNTPATRTFMLGLNLTF
ncbi:collagen-binding protein [Flavobacterium beibuense F44-8]|uniref:Collagen-binding protein n=1 Tax=Flavobacterium beibuense F44-8 TaxID=1406840 RepID=A0A0A2LNW8_9FLAO|nr:TonB-dependent receptor [Flavobacterium beibuense]KGO81619.1 collagen-binding protein [Flavobacterium beibuense F44-8]